MSDVSRSLDSPAGRLQTAGARARPVSVLGASPGGPGHPQHLRKDLLSREEGLAWVVPLSDARTTSAKGVQEYITASIEKTRLSITLLLSSVGPIKDFRIFLIT